MAKSYRDPEKEHRWRATVCAWRASGLTVREYCRRHRVAESSFHFWRRELRERDVAFSPPSTPPAFVPVTILPAADPVVVLATLAVEVRCPSGHVVSLPNADVATLRLLFTALAPLAGEASTC